VRRGFALAATIAVAACGGGTVRLGGAAVGTDAAAPSSDGGGPDVAAVEASSDASDDGSPGESGAGPIPIATGRSSPSWIVVDDTSVYWSEDGAAGTAASPNAVMKASKDGTGLTVLHADTGSPQGIALDDTYVYFLRYLQPGFELDRIAKNGDGATFAPIYSQSMGGTPDAVAVDATFAYFAVGSGILRISKAVPPDGNILHIGAQFGDAWDIALDGTLLYVGDRSGATPLTAMATADGGVEWSAGSGPGVGVAFDTTYVFWTSGTGVLRATKGGGAVSTLAPCATECDAVVADDVGIAWATLGEVVESALDGTQARTLASGFGGIHHAAIDAANVYFTDSTGGGVWRIAR